MIAWWCALKVVLLFISKHLFYSANRILLDNMEEIPAHAQKSHADGKGAQIYGKGTRHQHCCFNFLQLDIFRCDYLKFAYPLFRSNRDSDPKAGVDNRQSASYRAHSSRNHYVRSSAFYDRTALPWPFNSSRRYSSCDLAGLETGRRICHNSRPLDERWRG